MKIHTSGCEGKHHKYGIKFYTFSQPNRLNLKFTVYKDNFYNSIRFATKLLSKNTYCTGTLRVDWKHNPPQVIEKKKTLKKAKQ